MDIYQYIAISRPDAANDLCRKFGYDVANANDEVGLANCLKQLVALEGEPALQELAILHPDKDLILEMFSQPMGLMQEKKSSGCKCKEKTATAQYVEAAHASNANPQLQQGNLFLLGAILIVAVAIIAKN